MAIYDTFSLLASAVLFFVYGAILIISIIFTFSLDSYCKIDEIAKLDIIPGRILTSLEKNVDWVDVWLKKNNKIVGPILIIVSLIDLKFLLDLIKVL